MTNPTEPRNPPASAQGLWTPGSLRQRLSNATQRGLATGELLPLDTRLTTIVDGGVVFDVHILEQLQRKDAAKAIEIASKTTPRPPRNPFLPYESELFVADMSETHVAVLNKYNVLPHHMLIITREFQPQTSPLHREDLVAMGRCLQDVDGLGFFNGGEEAGASQPHKHLQLILLDLLPQHEHGAAASLPRVTDLFDGLLPLRQRQRTRQRTRQRELLSGPIQKLDLLPFEHGAIRFQDHWWKTPDEYTDMLVEAYQKLRGALTPQNEPYNWLLTRRWMVLVPRRREFYQAISINSLGFVGGLLVRNNQALALLHHAGPMHVLSHVGRPSTTPLS